MGFKYISLQTQPEALFRHNAGAILMYVGAWLCWEAIVMSRDAWNKDPTNAARFAQKYRERPSWVALCENHPATISQMIGDTKKAQGAVATAICLPACLLVLAGSLMVNQAWPLSDSEDALLPCMANVLRSVVLPVGFLMVLNTPVVTLDKQSYGETKTGELLKDTRVISEFEERWHERHHTIHGVGFLAAVMIGILLEVGFLATDLIWYFGEGVPVWETLPRLLWCILAGLRFVALVAQVLCVKNFLAAGFMESPLKDKRLQNYWKWMTEYGSLVLGGLIMMYDAASVLVFAGHLPHKPLGMVILAIILLETIHSTLGFFGFTCRWSGLSAFYDWNKLDFEGIISYVFNVTRGRPLVNAFKAKCQSELFGLDVAQAADEHSFTVQWHDLGRGLPAVETLLVCPGLVESVCAITFDELSNSDLKMYHEDLAKMLRQLPSAEIMVIPFGSQTFKFGRRIPLAHFPLTNYVGDLTKVVSGTPGTKPSFPCLRGFLSQLCLCEPPFQINSISYWPWRAKALEAGGLEEVARDITAPVLDRLSSCNWAVSLGLQHDMMRLEFLAQLEQNVDLRPLYKVLNEELRELEDYEVQLRGLVGGPPRFVAVTIKENLDKAKSCPLWCAGKEVVLTSPGTSDGKPYHKLE